MVDSIGDRVLVREFDDARDIEVVGKLEKSGEIGSNNKGTSIFTNNTIDPLCRIRFFPLHLLLVAELRENREIVGVIRGCIKHVGTKYGRTNVKLGCILGLRVSPTHRSLAIFVQPISFAMELGISQDIKVEKLNIRQAISLYDNKLKGKDLYFTDIDAILKENLSLGTWIFYFKQDEWIGLHSEDEDEDIISTVPPSWAMFSIWSSCEAYKIDIKKPHYPLKLFHEILSHARDKILPCLKNIIPICDYSIEKPFGFLFLYGIHGEGENDCKMIITELGVSDPMIKHVPHASSKSRIDDLWYFKKMNGSSINDENELAMMGELGNVVVDPRDF
ncbi:hypothetical protein V6Z11_A10G200800 [Gossypium hirsutum]